MFSSCIRNETNCFPSALFFAAVKIAPVLTSERYLIGVPSGLFGNDAVMMVSSYAFLPAARCSGVSAGLIESSYHFAAIEMVKLWVITVVLLWKATLLSGSFQFVEEGGVQPLI